jgi:hypothetical protein
MSGNKPGLAKLLKKKGCLHPDFLCTIWHSKIHHYWNLQINKFIISIIYSMLSTQFRGHKLIQKWNKSLTRPTRQAFSRKPVLSFTI